MNTINVYIEIGKKRTVACAVDWPGWCRFGRDEESALQARLDHAERYAQILQDTEIEFHVPADVSAFAVTERLDGNATTDFGAPAIMRPADSDPFTQAELERSTKLLQAYWQAFDHTVQQAEGRELRKGPRGGGRELEKILAHVLEADLAYLSRLAWKRKRNNENDLSEELKQTREAILSALEVAVNNGLPAQGPRGGVIWSPR